MIKNLIIALLVIVIGVFVFMLMQKSVPAEPIPVPLATSTATTTPAPVPLSVKVSVTFPKKDQLVQKKFTVIGKAPGNWFFEASAPVMVKDKDGSKIAQTTAQVSPPAGGDWMTTDLVDFTAAVNISSGYSGPATLVLLKDNPSGLPENDDSVEIPIIVQ
ncbi:hypothetical protein HY968_03565 [Candidatus Kaiserbacteria bacterium]|nr:hypothetical protein [Candidatus Kaiserbacteria bacterium]